MDAKLGKNPNTSGKKENEPPPKRLLHPLKCRLHSTAAIETSSPASITQVGFACWSLGMLTFFRPCYILLFSILERVDVATTSDEFKNAILDMGYFWFSLTMFVLFVLGFIPMFATSIKKRWILLLHPWMLMILYFDAFVLSTIAILLHVDLHEAVASGKNTAKQVKQTLVFFIIAYIDITVYFVLYYVYVTYYIVAELTIIEKFF